MTDDALAEQPYTFGFLANVYRYRMKLDQRHELFDEVEGLYTAKSAELLATFEAEEKSTDAEEQQDREEYFAMGARYLEDELPTIHRAATFIMLYHFLEAHLDEVCDGIGRELKSDVLLKHLTGTGIERAFLFLNIIGKLDLTAVQSEVQFVKSCRKLRNCMVHAGGQVNPANKGVLDFMANEPTLGRQAVGEVVITRDFVVKFFASLNGVFNCIHDALQDYMRKNGNTGRSYFLGAMGFVPFYGPDPQKAESAIQHAPGPNEKTA